MPSLSSISASASADQGEALTTKPETSFTPEALRARMDLVNRPELVSVVYGLASAQAQGETMRLARLDTKAAGLLTSAGAAIAASVAILNTTAIGASHGRPHTVEQVSLAVAALCGAIAGSCAINAIRVRPGAALDPTNVLSLAAIQDAEAATEAHGDTAVARYQRYLAAQLWQNAGESFTTNENKAWWVKAGQWALLGFMAALLVTLATTIFVACTQ